MEQRRTGLVLRCSLRVKNLAVSRSLGGLAVSSQLVEYGLLAGGGWWRPRRMALALGEKAGAGQTKGFVVYARRLHDGIRTSDGSAAGGGDTRE